MVCSFLIFRCVRLSTGPSPTKEKVLEEHISLSEDSLKMALLSVKKSDRDLILERRISLREMYEWEIANFGEDVAFLRQLNLNSGSVFIDSDLNVRIVK